MIPLSIRIPVTTAFLAVAASVCAGQYTVSFRSGTIPKDIRVENANGLLPNVDGYKRGWTRDGWIVDRLGSRGYVAVSPTFTATMDEDWKMNPVSPSLNVMTLPTLEIADGDILRWDARSVHPDFREAYRVVALVDGVREILYETEEERADWTTHVAALSRFAGKEVVISFECVSENRYILALDGIFVGTPDDLRLVAESENQVYYSPKSAPDGKTELVFSVLNAGKTLPAGTFSVNASYEEAGTIDIVDPWLAGDVRELRFPVELIHDRRVPYELYFREDGGSATLLAEGSLYLSDFEKRLMVDKGTGMWCVNCPSGVLGIEGLEREFGDAMIALDTHNNDDLANESYMSDLGFRSIPRMMLNRIRTSAGDSPELFFNFYYRPVRFGIEVTGIERNGNESAAVTARVESSEAVDNAAGRYRIGYVLTAEFFEPENNRFYQQNNENTTTGEQYYYLPSLIRSPLLKFHNVTLTHESAFTGLKGSLPASVEAGGSYEFTWNVTRPELLDDLGRGRIVAFVLDTETGEVLNSTAIAVSHDFSSVDDTPGSVTATPAFRVESDGRIALLIEDGASFALEIFTPDGRMEQTCRGVNRTGQTIATDVTPGIHIVRLTTQAGTVAKKIKF